MKKRNIASLILSFITLALAISPAAVARTSRVPDGQERHRVGTHARRSSAKRRKSVQQAQEVTYTCPMHHDVHLKSPGECPKCGMELEAETPVAKKIGTAKPVKAKSE